MRLWFWTAFFLIGSLLRAAETPIPLEQEISALVEGPQVTVVHFWAPWCPNCRNEMNPAEGWAKFIAANPHAKFVFVAIWHKDQDQQPKLAAGGLGAQPNLLLRTHPNGSRLAAERVNSFLGLPITWIPTTWVYRDGQLRAAFNYGEIRFPLLQQMLDDAQAKW